MSITLYPSFTLKVEVRDGAPQQNVAAQAFTIGGGAGYPKWHKPHEGKTGCDDLLAAVKAALAEKGIIASVTLDKFEWRA